MLYVRGSTLGLALYQLLNNITTDTGDIDHPGCAKAILSGCSKNKNPSFLIHLTGTGCISDEREQTWEGKYNPHIWHDIQEIKEIYDLPESAQHHVIDQKIMDASNDRLKTCIICPPDIYGQNTGLGSRATFLVPEYIKVLLKDKEAFYLGDGENIRAITHIDDVVDLFIILLGKAIEGGGDAQWGREVRNLQPPKCAKLTVYRDSILQLRMVLSGRMQLKP